MQVHAHDRMPLALASAGTSALPGRGARAVEAEPARDGGREAIGGSDAVEVSEEGLAALAADGAEEDAEAGEEPADGLAAGARGADGEPLTEEERAQVRELQARDREVRAHEQAHLAAAGNAAQGGPSYETERGPDGRQYAVGGEVPITLAEGRTPEETAANAERVRRAALAPAQPSSQDRAVAARAARQAANARAEAQASRGEEEGAAEEAQGADASEDERNANGVEGASGAEEAGPATVPAGAEGAEGAEEAPANDSVPDTRPGRTAAVPDVGTQRFDGASGRAGAMGGAGAAEDLVGTLLDVRG